ncbi:MAG TPA: hypothetical protein VJ483_10675 [Holophagaceae bacterium]|nr:hypothetical protein [Holophagaceae bacterium]
MNHELNLRPGWISHLFSWGLVAGALALPVLGYRYERAAVWGSPAARVEFSAIALLCLAAASLLARFILHRGHHFDEEGMTQVRPFRAPQHIRWEDIAMIVVVPSSSSWIRAFGQNRHQVAVDSGHRSSNLKWIAAAFLTRAPKEIWELQPETRQQLQDLIDGSVPWYHRPLF